MECICMPFKCMLLKQALSSSQRGELIAFVSNVFEPRHDKTNKMACAPSEDSDQPYSKEKPQYNCKMVFPLL